MLITLTGYDPAGAWTKSAADTEEIASWKNPSGNTWISVEGLDNPDEINKLAEFFNIHPLTVEDILDITQRPKVEEFNHYLFITLKDVDFSEELGLEQISIIITKDTVLSFQNMPNDHFDGIKKRIMNNAGRLRQTGVDFLAYAIMDSIIDEYFTIIDSFGSQIEVFEDRALDEKDNSFIQDLQELKRKLLKMRRVVWPMRESLSLLIHLDSEHLSDKLNPFLKDLYDHIIRAAETVETYRELIAGIMEINLSAASNRLNKVMKVLTIISTIFIPLTFIAGLYGMNFSNMPELEQPLAYFIVLGVMVIIALGMILFFKRRKWI